MQADTQHGAGFSEPAIEYAVIWLRFYWKTVMGWPAWLLRRGRQLIRAVVLQLGLGFSRARNLRATCAQCLPRNAAATSHMSHSPFRPDIGATERAESHDQQEGARYGDSAGCGTRGTTQYGSHREGERLNPRRFSS
jgi:hypothetical protein